MADQSQRLEIATVRAEVGSNIVYRFGNDDLDAESIPTASGDIQNLKKVVLGIQQEAAEKISISTTIYPTVDKGLAATADQGIFLVQSSDVDEIYTVWKNNQGSAENTGKKVISSAAIKTALEEANEAARAAEDAADRSTIRVDAFLSPSDTPPYVRDNGLPLQEGDTYFNTADQLEYIYKQNGWVAREQQDIGNLPAGTAVNDNDYLAVLQGDSTNKVLASEIGGAKAKFSHSATYPRGTIGSKLGQTVLVTDAPYNAVGDGISDDYEAIQAALDSGARVVALPARKISGATVYKSTKNLKYKFPGQVLIAAGIAAVTLLFATGTADGLTCEGLSSCGFSRIKISGSGVTAGQLVNINNSTGFRASSFRVENGWNGMGFHKINNCKIERFTFADLKGDWGVSFSGDSDFKSDVLNLTNGEFSHFSNSRINAIHWKSYAHSLSINNVRAIRGGRGLFVENSSGVESGVSYPSFLQVSIFETDFSNLEGIRLDCLQDAWITNLYSHESATCDNIYVSDKCKGIRLVIPRSASAFKNGIYIGGRAVQVIGGEFWSNSKQSSAMYDGIRVGSTARGVKIVAVISGDTDNGSNPTQGYGLNIEPGAQRVQYSANGFEGNVTGTLLSQADQSYEVGGTFRHSWKNAQGVHWEVGGSTPNVVNNLRAVGSATGGNVQILAQGSDANINWQATPKGNGCFVLPIGSIRNYSSDAQARDGGVPIGGLYRNGNAVQVRLT